MVTAITKKKDKVKISVIGGNSESVTGSCSKIEYGEHAYLFEFGMIQDGHTPLENYKLNKQLLQKIKPLDIEVIVIGHLHNDHIGMIPALFEGGKCKARIIVPKGSTPILQEMWLDSAYICQRDAEILSKKSQSKVPPLYTESGVFQSLKYIEEYESEKIFTLTDNLAIRYMPAGHILLSQQTEVFINGGSHTRKILFTSDLGNLITQDSKFFVEKFKPVNKANIVIGECTYAARARGMTKKDFELDIKKIKTVIEQYCIANGRRVLIPTFSLDRTPYILWILYQTFSQNKSFNIPIVIDSPLAIRLLDCYSSILSGENKEKFDEMLSWKNIRLVVNPEDSKAAIADHSPKVILSASGMMVAGRCVKWTQNILPHEDDCILFVGYATDNSLAARIKHENEQKTISINGRPYKNKVQVVDLKSFSSHMQRKDLLNYYKGINCEKIYLVHSNAKERLEFKEDLENAISGCLKTTKVIATNKSTIINL